MTLRHRTTALALLAVGSLALAGCAESTATTGSADTSTTASAASAAESVTVTDPWVKAADEGMSAAFGEITNDGDADVTLTVAQSDAAGMVELHETVADGAGEMSMQEIDGGFVIPAGQTLTLEPGGNHLMFMDLTGPLEAGAEVTVTLTFSDDSTTELTAPVKDYSGANESYTGDDESAMDEDMDMGEDGSDDGEHADHEGH
ncbi:copper chaperone PCu(A)C [Isoptericola jiangsuensis]|uniref:copper chaperone PCu(A)C n=1 Tax=Isoptericola jiangsuensis TaxID=548579 RepID=UPI003AAD8167